MRTSAGPAHKVPTKETQTEVFTFLRLIVILNKKAESEDSAS